MALDSSTVRLLSQLAEGDGKPLHECSPDEARSKDVGYQIHSNPIGFQYIRASCPDKNVKITYRLQACNEPARSADPFCELTVPDNSGFVVGSCTISVFFSTACRPIGCRTSPMPPETPSAPTGFGEWCLLRRRQASGRPLQQGHLPLRMPRQAREDRRSQVWVSEPPWTRA